MIAIDNDAIYVSISVKPWQRLTLQDSGFRVCQRGDRTVLYTLDPRGLNYEEHDLPHLRYSLAHDTPGSIYANAAMDERYPTTQGREQFEADFRAFMALYDETHL